MSDYKKALIATVYPESPEIRVADDPLHKDARFVIERLRAELDEAASSLEWCSQARSEDDIHTIRYYAANRARVAREALE